MPFKEHPTDPDKLVYVSRKYDFEFQPKPMNPQEFYDKLRNDVLEEVACEFDKMKSLGDTASSFAVFVRSMKR